MNYLAHAYLSFHHDGILTGNMISDFVKGKRKLEYGESIQKGIALHRAIDCFTDVHEATKQAKEVFRPSYRLYSGAFVDVLYDHFLATDEKIFSGETLAIFATQVYETLDKNLSLLPEGFQAMFPYMKAQNWLYNYRYRRGTEKSFGGLVGRAAYLEESETACALFHENYELLKTCYQAFMPAIAGFARKEFETLTGL